MASESVGIDDIVATLMSMGFEFNDCQEAITNGKLTVQAAIDWILAGKPDNVAASQPSLKLNRGQTSGSLQGGTSNPFVPENVSSLRGSSGMETSSSSSSMGVDVEDDTVISRSHLTEKQQQIKLDFEEKERQEARRSVQEEKRKKKLERERILKEIQEDREKQKLTKQSKTEIPSTSQTQSQGQAASSSQTSGQTKTSPDAGSNSIAIIQVRLPSGQLFRGNFPVTGTLNQVWDSVYQVIKTGMNAYSGFIQPFPRREFTREEMGHTLAELGLVPSGSLVLKKKDVQQATPMDTENTQPGNIIRALEEADRARQAEEGEREEEDLGVNPWNGPPDPNVHRWGRGQRVEDGGDDEENMDVDQAGDEDRIPEHNFDPLLGLAMNPVAAGRAFRGFGQRLVTAGVPGDDGRHLNRRAGEMAAEAAAQRYAQPPEPQASRAPEPKPAEHLYTVSSLQDLAMHILARRLTDPRQPIFSLSGLSEELLQTFLSYLMKELLLKPKILHLIPSYLLKLVLDYYPYTTNDLLHAARIFTHLQVLSLNSCTLITDSGLNALKGMKALKTINLNGCSQITNSSFSVFTELKNLQSLNLEGTGVTDVGVIEFARSEACPQLLHLDLSRTAVTHEIFIPLQNFKKLKSLFLKQTRLTSLAGVDGVVTLENLDISETHVVTDSILCLTRLPKLSHVSLTGTQEMHGDRALYYLKDMKLTALFLPSRTTTSDVGMAYISGFHLSALDLTNYVNVGDGGMAHIGKITSLRRLVLSNTKVSDDGMQQLAGLVHLEVLFVDRTLVSNPGASVVTNFRHLQELSLSATSVTNELLREGVLNRCYHLTKLNMSRTIVGDKGIANLKLPNLQLLNLDCTRVHPQSETMISKNCPNLKSVTICHLSAVVEDDDEF